MTSNNKIPLYTRYGNRRIRVRKYLILTLLSVAFLTVLFYLYLHFTEGSEVSYFMLPYYLIVPLILLWDSKEREKQFIQIEENRIIFKNSKWIKQHEITADEISYIKINTTNIKIATKDLRSFQLELTYAKHSDIKKIKTLLTDFRRNSLK